jgi:hypothetical protein
MSRTRISLIALATGMMMLAASQASGQSLGFLKLPSTVPQYLGWGYGAGHHAPIVKTPAMRPPRMQRMTYYPAYCGPLWPADYEPIGCYGGACPTCELGVAAPIPPVARQAAPPFAPPPVALRPTPYGWR